nr:immunoglobulin heavy chain junction region [Macaca mulatta]MOV49918.1 immunoglobulin heavy chain junction region [Macaca mulatta]MOV51898.1 immunoglobulin heavy chain junction region [Macaca mulatta]MOV52159.1 immunoglobulin heavy chain junction region [Macaca mulatta]
CAKGDYSPTYYMGDFW